MTGWGRKCVSSASESLQLHRCCPCCWTHNKAQLLRPSSILLWDTSDPSCALLKSIPYAPYLRWVLGALLFSLQWKHTLSTWLLPGFRCPAVLKAAWPQMRLIISLSYACSAMHS